MARLMRDTCKDTTSSEGMSCLDCKVEKTAENRGVYFKQLQKDLPAEKFQSLENLGEKPYVPVLL